MRYLISLAFTLFSIAFAFPSSGFAQMMMNSGTFGSNQYKVTYTFHTNSLMLFDFVSGQPYSAEEKYTSTQKLYDGTNIVQSRTERIIYRDSKGRTRTERPFNMMHIRKNSPVIDMPVVPEIVDPVAYYAYYLDPENKVAHRVILPGSFWKSSSKGILSSGNFTFFKNIPMVTSASSGSVSNENEVKFSSESIGTQMIQGIEAQGKLTTTVYPIEYMGNDRPIIVTNETWRSSELNVDMLTKYNDPRQGENKRELINIIRSEPDAKLFQIPDDYKIVDEEGQFSITLTGPGKKDSSN